MHAPLPEADVHHDDALIIHCANSSLEVAPNRKPFICSSCKPAIHFIELAECINGDQRLQSHKDMSK